MYGVSGDELCWFMSYLDNRKQAVNIGSSLSSFQNINIGVPQGSILGPLLFLIHVYVNNLSNCVNCKTVMYADDTNLLFRSSHPNSLQEDLNNNSSNIGKWFLENNLTLNINKTKLMIFGTNNNLDKFKGISLNYNNYIIERVDHFKYLGVIFDNQMTWLDHINHVSANISKRCGVLNRVKYNLPNCTLKMLAEAMIIPNFDYCSPVWSNCNNELKTSLQKHQNKLARIILSADIRTPINNMMTSLNWLKLDDRWTNQMLIMIFKCLNGTSPNKNLYLLILYIIIQLEVRFQIPLLFHSVTQILVDVCSLVDLPKFGTTYHKIFVLIIRPCH